MNPIKVIYLGGEKGQVKNPYVNAQYGTWEYTEMALFEQQHPPLPMPNPNNDLVEGKEYFAVEVWQYSHDNQLFYSVLSSAYINNKDYASYKSLAKGAGYFSRRIYTPVTEEAKEPKSVQGETVPLSAVIEILEAQYKNNFPGGIEHVINKIKKLAK